MTSTEDTAVQNDASNETVVKDNIAMQVVILSATLGLKLHQAVVA